MSDTRTIDSYIDANGITMESSPAFNNPNMADSVKNSSHFEIMITGPDGPTVCHYSVGPAIVERFLKEKYAGQTQGMFNPMRRTLADNEFYDQHKHEYGPALRDVLNCLADDASSYENCRGFEDWAGDYGYDTDSRKAKATYDAIEKQSADLRRALGLDLYRHLIEDVERL